MDAASPNAGSAMGNIVPTARDCENPGIPRVKLRDEAPAEPTLPLPPPFKCWAEPNSGLMLRAAPIAMIRACRRSRNLLKPEWSLLDLLYRSTSFAFHLPALSMEAKTSPVPVGSSWEEGSEGRRQGEFGGQKQEKEKGCWRTLGDHSRAWKR